MTPEEMKKLMQKSGVSFDNLPPEQQEIILGAMQNKSLSNQSDPLKTRIITDPVIIKKEAVLLSGFSLTETHLKKYLKHTFKIIDSSVYDVIRDAGLHAIAVSDSVHESRVNSAIGLLFYKKRYEPLWILAHEAAEMNQIDTSLLKLYAGLLSGSGGPNLALPILKWLDKIEPNNSSTLNNIGYCWYQLLQLDSADFYLKKSIKADSTNSSAYYTRSHLLEDKKAPTEEINNELMHALKYGFSEDMFKDAERHRIKIRLKDIGWPFRDAHLSDAAALYHVQIPQIKLEDCNRAEKEFNSFNRLKEALYEWQEIEDKKSEALADRETKKIADNPYSILSNNLNEIYYSVILNKKNSIFSKEVDEELEVKRGRLDMALESYKTGIETISKRYENLLKENEESLKKCHDYCDNVLDANNCKCPCYMTYLTKKNNLICSKVDEINTKYFLLLKDAKYEYQNLMLVSNYYKTILSEKGFIGNVDGFINAARPSVASVLSVVCQDHHYNEQRSSACDEFPLDTSGEHYYFNDDSSKFVCNTHFQLNLGAISAKFNCDKIALTGGELLLFKLEKKFDKNGYGGDLELGVGLGLIEKFSLNSPFVQELNAGVNLNLSSMLIFKFNKDNELKDFGYKQTAKLGASAGLYGVNAGSNVEASHEIYLNASAKTCLGLKFKAFGLNNKVELLD